MSGIAVIIVTHDSEDVLEYCMASLEQYGGDCAICIIDSGSSNTVYLQQYESWAQVKIVYHKNIGFGRANNIGYQLCAAKAEYIVFLNPDAFITKHSFTAAQTAMSQNPAAGCLGGRLLGYDLNINKATGKLDSTGIFRKWYGRWVDRGQGQPDIGQYGSTEKIPAACAAFLFCRKEMLEQVALANRDIFDPDFFLYKEDIELGLRITKSRWHTLYVPEIKVYHCRGWQQRDQMSRQFRLTSAANEILLYKKHTSPYMAWAILKYILVRLLRI